MCVGFANWEMLLLRLKGSLKFQFQPVTPLAPPIAIADSFDSARAEAATYQLEAVSLH